MNLPVPGSLTGSQTEQLRQLQSYLTRLSEELSFALSRVERQLQDTAGQVHTVRQETAAIRRAQTPRESFAALKSLIIRSADIVDAYSQEVSRRLAGEYVAQSEFGTYRQQTAQDIQENAREVRRSFTDLQELRAGLTEVETAVTRIHAWIRAGQLTEEAESPVYGIEIGQQTEVDGAAVFHKFARLTADRLSFFDRNGVEVSTIGDETMRITRARAGSLTFDEGETTRLRLGDYLLYADQDGHLTVS